MEPQPRAPPSELLSPDEVPDDQHDGPPRYEHREQQEEPRRRPGGLTRVTAELIGRVDPPLSRRPVLPEPPEDDQGQGDQEAPEPGEVEPVDVPCRRGLECLVVRLQILVVLVRLCRRVASRHPHRPTPPRRTPTRVCSSPLPARAMGSHPSCP